MRHNIPCDRIHTAHIQCGAKHPFSGCGNDGIGFRMQGAAHLIPLASGNLQLFPHAEVQITAILSAARSTVVSGRNDGIIFHKNCTITASKTGTAFRHSLCNIQIVIVFGDSFHTESSVISVLILYIIVPRSLEDCNRTREDSEKTLYGTRGLHTYKYHPGKDVRTIQKTRRFFFNAAMMAAVQIFLRGASVSFNAYISARVGAEGMGLITLVMSVSGLALTVAVSGIQLASVQLTAQALAQTEAENHVNGKKRIHAVLRGCILYSLFFGCVAALLLFFSSELIGRILLHDIRTIPSLRALSLSLPAVALSSALGGYFTGMRRIYKNAIVTVAEQFFKIMLTAAALLLLSPAGIEYACLSVVGGGVVAQFLSLLLSFLLYIPEHFADKKAAGTPPALRLVFQTAFPTAVGAYARQGLLSAEHLAIPWGLQKSGASSSDALSSYGVLHGMVYPLVFFPSAILGAFAGLLVPEFAEATERGQNTRIRHMAERVIRTALLFAIGAAGIFLSFSHEIANTVYPGTNAGNSLSIIAPLIPVMYLDTVVDSMLKGMGEQLYCMKVNIADASICLVLVLILLPRFGMSGYYCIQYLCELMNAALSISRLISVTSLRPRILSWVARPLFCIILSTAGIRFLSGFSSIPLLGSTGTLANRIVCAILLYIGLVCSPMIMKKMFRKDEKPGNTLDKTMNQ